MPKPIIMTDAMKQEALNDFSAILNGAKMPDGKFSYNKSFNYKDGDVTIWLTMEAYQKIVTLVVEFSNEVGWHGAVTRISDNEFVIEDIYVYPQEVTASTVNTNQEAYTEWLYKLDDNTFNNIRMQGHSHNNMGVSPSGIDDKHRQQILDQLEPDMFYIFMIWNKSLSIHTLVYDMQRNILYEDKDVEVKLLGNDGLDVFLADAKVKVQKISHKKGKHGSKNPKTAQADQLDIDDEFEGFGSYRQYGVYGSYRYGGY